MAYVLQRTEQSQACAYDVRGFTYPLILRRSMKNNLIQFTVATVCAMSTTTVWADDMYREAWYVMPGASILRADSDLESKHHGGGLFLKWGKEVAPDWDIQGGFTYNRVREDTGIAGVGGHYKQISLGADLLYMFNRQQFRPFLLIGGGVARNNVDYSNLPGLHDEMRTSWMGNVGLGAQLFLNDRFGLQADVRRQWSKSDAKAPASNLDSSGTISNTVFNIGGIFRFGAPPPPPTVAENVSPAPAPVVAEKPVERLQPPVPEAAAVNCKPRFETVTLSVEKLFAFDKFEMQSGAKPLLDDVVAQLKAYPDFELVMITGHTDRIGPARYNQRLSEQRANQVKEYLISSGIAANRLKSIGMGETDPKVTCTGMRGEQLIECLQPNRRVVIEEQAQLQMEKKPGCP